MDQHAKTGFVGLGHVGRPMAGSLATAGWPLTVYDLDNAVANAFAAEHSCAVAATPTDLADADVIVTMLPNGHVVREVILESGLADALRPGTLVLDTSSSDPLGTRELAATLAERSIQFVDAGVSMPEGGRAAERMITFMCGAADAETFARAEAVLRIMGNEVFLLGPVGAGHVMKTLNNYIATTALAGSLDALVAAEKYGLDLATFIDVLNVSTGRNFNTEFPLRERAITRRFDSGYALGLLVKDLGIAERFAEGTEFENGEFDTSMFELMRRLFADAMDDVGPGADHLRVLEHWERRAGLPA
jgi:3-hydroxyisobutyrate dehydrogenase-like beta-hydroxyacid dehydrogenase